MARRAMVVALLCCGACGESGSGRTVAQGDVFDAAVMFDAAAATNDPVMDAAPPVDAAVPTGPAVVLVTDPDALAVVAKAGGAFDALLPEVAYRSLAATIKADIDAIAAADPKAGVGIRGYPHRLFDTVWLDKGRFELVAVVNRLDRIPQTPGRCGDARLVFRLAYSTKHGGSPLASRLPMTVAVVLEGPPDDSGCRDAARRWKRAGVGDKGGGALGAWLVSDAGPLGRGALAPAHVARVLTNVQAVRWPSGAHPDLGGHTEYLFREHVPDDNGQLSPNKLLAVPDVGRIRKNRALRAKLTAWARNPDTVRAVDEGNLVLPPELRATVSKGVTPRGFSRLANRAFRSLLNPGVLAKVDLKSARVARTPEALLRRMDELTCAGCHQARTIAGFHLLGEDGDDVAGGNALAMPMSAHLAAETKRRAAIVEALAAGQPPDLVPPFAERPPGSPGVAGAPCGLGDDGFAAWTCNKGLECQRVDQAQDDTTVGICATPEVAQLGEACDVGPINAHRDPRRDRVPEKTEIACPEGLTCKISRQGFPAGQCASKCSALPRGGSCIMIGGPGFNNCLLAGKPYPTCVTENATRMGVARCSAKVPCRDDYVCVKALRGGAGCLPPYFMFQLRVDGHPSLADPPPEPDLAP